MTGDGERRTFEECSAEGANHYKAWSPYAETGQTWEEECPVCEANICLGEELPQERPSSSEPTIVSALAICCDCGRTYSPRHKSWSFSSKQVYPDWVREQFANEWVVYTKFDPCECGCHFFSRVRTFDPAGVDEDTRWYGEK